LGEFVAVVVETDRLQDFDLDLMGENLAVHQNAVAVENQR
jgi:hypothetical protein